MRNQDEKYREWLMEVTGWGCNFTSQMPGTVYTPIQAATILNVSNGAIYKAIKDGRLPAQEFTPKGHKRPVMFIEKFQLQRFSRVVGRDSAQRATLRKAKVFRRRQMEFITKGEEKRLKLVSEKKQKPNYRLKYWRDKRDEEKRLSEKQKNVE
ncbi:MAG: hypothetical protein HN975_16005 [Anaerolineae bacterium]|jgi:excisionase family DNA binding protein|nr:hypothetical protein [Anaerolineae bacterium]